MLSLNYRENLKHIFLKEDFIMSETLKNVADFTSNGSACGAADPKEDKPSSACGSACGAADPDKK